MHLLIKKKLKREIIHYASDSLSISSLYNKIFITKDGHDTYLLLPRDGWKSIFSLTRLSRRALRLDKCNVIPVKDDLVVIRQGQVYYYDSIIRRLSPTLKLRNCRNILHQSMLVTDKGELFFGEYGNNASRKEVPVYRSQDWGRTWEVIFTFPAGKIKHVHGCFWDPYELKIWVFTGDFAGECHALCVDTDFKQIEWIGNGQQDYRMCNAFFEDDSIHWIMDSQSEESYHVRMDRSTRQIKKISRFPGPVWYIKKLTDGFYLAATAQEIGPGVLDNYAHVLVSKDLSHWEDILQFKHDGFPKRFFKFGVIGFADGPQTSQGFYMFGEALQNMDGKSALCQIK
jgi:hypothetical protein